MNEDTASKPEIAQPVTEPGEPGAGHRRLNAMPAVTCSAWLGDVVIRKPHGLVILVNVISLVYLYVFAHNAYESFLVFHKYILALNAYALGATLRQIIVKIRSKDVYGDWDCHTEHDELGNARRVCRRVINHHGTLDSDSFRCL